MHKNQSTFVKESQILFNTPMKWFESLDENKFLIGFDNGVYDLKNKEFRDGKPDDKITKTVGYKYTDKINPTIKKKVLSFFTECLPEESKEFLLKLSAYCLSGNRYLEWLVFLIGTGGNGKGAYKTLMTKTLGEYSYEPSVAMLTTTVKSSSNASPDKAKSKGVRCMICEEPEDEQDTTLKVGYLKELSGGNKIQARELFKSPMEFLPQFQLFLMMNNPVKLNTFDGGIERRLKNIEFPYKFVDNPLLPHEKKKDLDLKDNFDNNQEYYQQFFLILIEYYCKYIDGSKHIDVPDSVKKFTDEYLGESNVVKKFICDNYEITNNPDDKLKYTDVYNAFKVENKNMDKTKFSNQLKINGFKKTDQLRYKGSFSFWVEGLKEKNNYICELDEPE
jgi:putative DNA primase/helicase